MTENAPENEQHMSAHALNAYTEEAPAEQDDDAAEAHGKHESDETATE